MPANDRSKLNADIPYSTAIHSVRQDPGEMQACCNCSLVYLPYHLCCTVAGAYVQKDLNMPVTLRSRSDGPKGFSRDSPITQVGRVQARLTGECSDSGLELPASIVSVLVVLWDCPASLVRFALKTIG